MTRVGFPRALGRHGPAKRAGVLRAPEDESLSVRFHVEAGAWSHPERCPDVLR